MSCPQAALLALRELFFATTGEIRAVSFRGVNPGGVNSVSTMDNGEIPIWFEKGEEGVEGVTGLGVLREWREEEEMAADGEESPDRGDPGRKPVSGEPVRLAPASPFCRSRASVRRRMSL